MVRAGGKQYRMLEQSTGAMIAKAYFLNIAGQYQEQKVRQCIAVTDHLKKIYLARNKVGTADALDVQALATPAAGCLIVSTIS